MEKTKYELPLLSVAILDFQRPKELGILLDSLDKHLKVPAHRVYCHDGLVPDYALDYLKNNRIDTLITTAKNQGCGIQTRQLFQSCLTEHLIYCQVDQFLIRDFTETDLIFCVEGLKLYPNIFYCDLAQDQGRGRPSERASLFNRKRYLEIKDLDKTIGGPGPYSDHLWTEQLLQEYMAANDLKFVTMPMFFADNGKWSRRAYPCGGETLHSTDEKRLYLVKPLKQRYNFPNLRLQESEWLSILDGTWVNGTIPEADKAHSFKVWD